MSRLTVSSPFGFEGRASIYTKRLGLVSAAVAATAIVPASPAVASCTLTEPIPGEVVCDIGSGTGDRIVCNVVRRVVDCPR